jgi:hypothetical protein
MICIDFIISQGCVFRFLMDGQTPINLIYTGFADTWVKLGNEGGLIGV